MKNIIGFLCLAFFIASCGGSTKDNGCKMGTPQAMFSETLTGITGHNFKLVQNNSTEEFTFNGTPVVIYQTGCDQIRQEFQLSYDSKTADDKASMHKIADVLLAWSKLGDRQQQFSVWSQQIRMVSNEMQLGESFSPSSTIEIALDRVNQAEGEILTLTLTQKE